MLHFANRAVLRCTLTLAVVMFVAGAAEARNCRRGNSRNRRCRASSACCQPKSRQPAPSQTAPVLGTPSAAVAPEPDSETGAIGALVNGTITHNAQSLAGGSISFVSRDGTAFSANLDQGGTFTMRLSPGDYTVTIRSLDAEENAVPAKYTDAGTSGLTVTVQDGGRNDFSFELVD